jgi:ferric-dicitrate binding protein FerR (iron transport regulator)
MKDNSHINVIIIKAITEEKLSLLESADLDQWLTDAENSNLFEGFKDNENLLRQLIEFNGIDVEGHKLLLDQKMDFGKRIDHITKRQWISFRDVATSAAAVLILAAATFFYLNIRKPDSKPAPTEKVNPVVQLDVAPGKTTALLTLADGRKLVLDSTVTGQLAKQGETIVVNDSGTLKYQGSNQPPTGALYNILSTANGETYGMVLADGSKVWLNTGASIRYPVSFTGNERKVQVTGEAYFEVAHDAAKPFIVDILPATEQAGGGQRGMSVEVLGTHFNINAYHDEAVIKTTLLEGSVKVVNRPSSTDKEQTAILKPGQQALISPSTEADRGEAADSQLIIQKNVDVNQVIAWKNGRFNFVKAEITVVMRQLAKWYNIEVGYEGARTAELLTGEMARDQMLSQTVKMLELAAGIHARIEGRKLIVMSDEVFEARKKNATKQK